MAFIRRPLSLRARVRSINMVSTGMFLIMAAGGCASAGQTAAPGQAVILQPGERVTLPDDASLRYIAVTADSRCPPDVQCIRAGDADVAFEFVSGQGAASSVTLNTANAPTAPIGEWRLRLLSLEFGASPRATVQIDAAGH